MREWINKRFGLSLREKDLKSVRDFSLIWNIFEATVCETNFSIARVEQALENRKFDQAEFEPVLAYFKNRYVTNNAVNQRFQQLHFRRNDRGPFVEEVLLGRIKEAKQVILALSIIIYRFRNNLFHGLKSIREIDQQNRNFENANDFLKTLLDYF